MRFVRWIRRAPLVGAVLLLLGSPLAASGDASRAVIPGPVSVVQTTVNLSEHLQPQPALRFSTAVPAKGVPVVKINDGRRFQVVKGFGAAMTDSSAWLIEGTLPVAARASLMGELFGATGIRLNYLRVPIGASDFTVGSPYSYDDVPPGQSDPTLSHFSIAHDRAYVLPALVGARAQNPQLQFIASPWSSPGWMKGNDSLGNSYDKGTLRGAAYGPWAAYIVKFIQAYDRAGVPISSLTPQNEPQIAVPYPGMNISEGAEANWVAQDLVPALARAHLKVKVYAGDLGWSKVSVPYFRSSLSGPMAKYLGGLAWHCYYGTPDVMSSFHAEAPGLDEVMDECSPGISAIPLADVVISSLRNWASAVALWNIALDPSGGPVQKPNVGCYRCYGLAMIDPRSHAVRLTNAYFQLGQASQFIQPGAVRVGATNFVTYDYTRPGVDFVSKGLDDVALVNPDGSHVLLAHNAAQKPLTFAVSWQNRYFGYTLPAGATVTFSWRSGS